MSALFVFSVPLLVAAAVTESDPELRLIRTGESFSALVVTDRTRILIVNSGDRNTTRSAVGYLARPWEPDASTVLAPANDEAAVGLWEALRDPAIRHAIIVGVPGRDPTWSRIERDCADRGIRLEYVTSLSQISMRDVSLAIEPVGMTLSVHSGQAAVAIALADEQPTLNASVAVVNEIGTSVQHADLVIAPAYPSEPSDVPIIAVNAREIIRLKFDSNEVRVQGGRLQMGETEAN